MWRRARVAVLACFVANLVIFLSVFIAGATSPWVFGVTAAAWLASRAARSRYIPRHLDPDLWHRAVWIVSAGCVGGAFLLALVLLPALRPLFG